MRANILFVRERFEHFNRLCFDGALPMIPLRISSSGRTLGTLRFPRIRPKQLRPDDVVLSISSRLDLDRAVVEDTIIHEMIHLYIYWFDIRDTSAHGPAFRRIMTDINARHGRNITITRRTSTEERNSDRLKKFRMLLVCTLVSGEKTVTVCTPKYTIPILNAVRHIRDVRATQLYVTNSPLFARYPSSRTAKLYRIEQSELDRELKSATPAYYKDGKFRYN